MILGKWLGFCAWPVVELVDAKLRSMIACCPLQAPGSWGPKGLAFLKGHAGFQEVRVSLGSGERAYSSH
jgi:hypothetical protein